MVSDEGRTCESKHAMADRTINLIVDVKNTWKIPLYVQNQSSLLADVIPVLEL